MTDEPKGAAGYGSPFLQILNRQDEGRVVEAMDEIIADINMAVIQCGGKGTATLKIITEANGDHGLTVTMEVTGTAPKRQFAKSFQFTDSKGRFTRQVPESVSDSLLQRT